MTTLYSDELEYDDIAGMLGAVSFLLEEAAYEPRTADSPFDGDVTLCYRHVRGLGIILDAAAEWLSVKHVEIDEQFEEMKQQYPAFASDIPEWANTDEGHRSAWRDGYKAALNESRDYKAALDKAALDAARAFNATYETPEESPTDKMSVADAMVDQDSDNETSAGHETYPKVAPDLSARETAIAETFRKGYPPEEIASAVNLKRATVERIIGKLKDAGTIPQEPDNPSHAASA